MDDSARSADSPGALDREFLASLTHLFTRDLQALGRQIEAYASQSDLWVRRGAIPNSAGNLALHLVGNLNHFLGATLGGTGFVRDRDAEFADRNIPVSELLGSIRSTERMVEETLASLPSKTLSEPYPNPPEGMRGISTMRFLTHLATHLAYHLGQVNYHRRLVDSQNTESGELT
jgi:uncharacterized damage-inducible protein DinB